MPDRQHSSLTFPLEETLWFEKGQEVDELISISLDPHITIEENDDIIILSGSLELNGEYKHISQMENAEKDIVIPVQGRKYIHTVETRNEEESAFIHRFPVEIVIPKHRIPNMDEIDVGIQTFDYELPEKEQLKVIAEVYVQGLYEESESFVVNDRDYESTVPADVEQEQQDEHADIPLEVEQELVEERNQEIEDEEIEVALVDHTEDIAESVQEEEALDVREDEFLEEDVEEVDHIEESSQQSLEELEESFTAMARYISNDETENEELEKDQNVAMSNLPQFSYNPFTENILDRNYEPHYYESNIHTTQHPKSSYVESSTGNVESSSLEESVSSDFVEKKKKKKKKDKYEAISFADFFARKEEQATSTLKVRLVQQGDSIEELANQYNVSPQQILRANHMETNNDVIEGQVLYIPSQQANKKFK